MTSLFLLHLRIVIIINLKGMISFKDNKLYILQNYLFCIFLPFPKIFGQMFKYTQIVRLHFFSVSIEVIFCGLDDINYKLSGSFAFICICLISSNISNFLKV